MSHEYPPLPEPDRTMWQYGKKKDHFTADQLHSYAAPLLERIAELEGAVEAERKAMGLLPAARPAPKWVVVPVEPTTGMLVAGNHCQPGDYSAAAVWATMVDASQRSADYTKPLLQDMHPPNTEGEMR